MKLVVRGVAKKEKSETEETIERVGRPQEPLLNLPQQDKPQLELLFSFFLSLNNRDSTSDFIA